MPYLLNDDGEIETCSDHGRALVRHVVPPLHQLPQIRALSPRERRRRAREGTRGRRGARPVDRWTGFSARPLDEVVETRVWSRREFGWRSEYGHNLRDALYVPDGTSDDAVRAALAKVELIVRGYASPTATHHTPPEAVRQHAETS